MKILKVVADGYERVTTIKTNMQELTFSYLDYDNYIEGESTSTHQDAKEQTDIELKLVMGQIDVSGNLMCGSIVQPIRYSPHTIITGIIQQIDDDVVTVMIENYGSIEAELEDEAVLNEGDIVSIKGELTSEEGLG